MHAIEAEALQALASLEGVFLQQGAALEGLTPLASILGYNRPPSFGEWIANQLASEIIRGEIESGAPIREIELSARFQTSRTPVREAIRLLSGYGLLEGDSHRSHSVRPLTQEEITRISEARLAIEMPIARLVALRLHGVVRDEMVSLRENFELAARAGDKLRFLGMLPRFQFLKFLAARNMYLTAMYTTIAYNVARVWFRSVEDSEPLELKRERLVAQADAYLCGDPDAAADVISRSIRHSWASLQGGELAIPTTLDELAGHLSITE